MIFRFFLFFILGCGLSIPSYATSHSPAAAFSSPLKDSGIQWTIKITEDAHGVRFHIHWPSHQHIKKSHFSWRQRGQILPASFWRQHGSVVTAWLEDKHQHVFQSPSIWLTKGHPLSLEWMIQGCSQDGICYFPQAFQFKRLSTSSPWMMEPIAFSPFIPMNESSP